MKRILIILLVLCVSAGAFAGGTKEAAGEKAGDDVIKIGAIYPLTGGVAPIGFKHQERSGFRC